MYCCIQDVGEAVSGWEVCQVFVYFEIYTLCTIST
jgi:hypothetical protein